MSEYGTPSYDPWSEESAERLVHEAGMYGDEFDAIFMSEDIEKSMRLGEQYRREYNAPRKA